MDFGQSKWAALTQQLIGLSRIFRYRRIFSTRHNICMGAQKRVGLARLQATTIPIDIDARWRGFPASVTVQESLGGQIMRASQLTKAVLAGVVVATFGVAGLWADDPQQPRQNQPTTNAQPANQFHANAPARTDGNDRALVIRTMPSKKVVGSNIQNTKGEKVGSIDDLVI